MAFSVNDVKGYVDANGQQLIGKAVIGAKSAKLFNLQTGVKGSAYLNLLTADATVQDGSACGWTAAGTTTVSKRQITTALMKVNAEFCDKDLINTAMQYDVKVAVGSKTLPFEEDFINQNIKSINTQVENLIWQGDTDLTGSTYLKLTDGLIKIIGAASGATGAIDASVSGTTLLGAPKTAIDAIVAKIPDAILDRDDIIIFVGVDVYRKYVKALQDANLFHYVPANLDASFSTIVPGTNIRVEGVAGLTGKNKAFASYAENFYLGTDMEGDYEKFQFWYSEDNRMFRLAVEFNLGVQIAFPDLIVKYIG